MGKNTNEELKRNNSLSAFDFGHHLMAGSSWLVDGNRFATKIRSVSGTANPERFEWQSNPTRPSPSCLQLIDNSDVAQMWPGLPSGVKFDPSDQEIIVHLLAKAGIGESKSHPFIDEFIPTLSEDDGICYTHPQKLPGVKQDGSASHFFHRATKAYNTGTRKRRKINDADFGDVRWHKTGKTKPVMLNGVQRGCKKIMVLYTCSVKGSKPEKTNWVMHQYHHGTDEDEKDGEYVISKIYYQQQQQMKTSDISYQDIPESNDVGTVQINPITPKSVTPGPPRMEGKCVNVDSGQNVTCTDHLAQDTEIGFANDIQAKHNNMDHNEQVEEENHTGEGMNWCDIESQDLLDSQQLIEALSLCDDLLQSHSPGHEVSKSKASLSDYSQLGSEHLKKDLERQDHVVNTLNTEIDTPPDFRLSQLEFESDDSYLAWGGTVDQ